jgi:hypothetical protein
VSLNRSSSSLSGDPPSPGGSPSTKGGTVAKRPTSGVVCPRCGMHSARVIGRSESLPVIYLRCDECGRTSVSPD